MFFFVHFLYAVDFILVDSPILWYLFIYSFIYLFIYSFICLFIHLFIFFFRKFKNMSEFKNMKHILLLTFGCCKLVLRVTQSGRY